MSFPEVAPQLGYVAVAVPPDEYTPDAPPELATVKLLLVLAVIVRLVMLSEEGVIPVTVTVSPTANVFADV